MVLFLVSSLKRVTVLVFVTFFVLVTSSQTVFDGVKTMSYFSLREFDLRIRSLLPDGQPASEIFVDLGSTQILEGLNALSLKTSFSYNATYPSQQPVSLSPALQNPAYPPPANCHRSVLHYQ